MAPRIPVADAKRYLDLEQDTADWLVQVLLDEAWAFVASEFQIQLDPLPAIPTDPPVVVTRRAGGSRFVRVPDLTELDALTVDGVDVDTSTVMLWRRPGKPEDSPAVKLEVPTGGDVAVITGRFGYQTLPADLYGALLLLVGRDHAERAALFSDAYSLGGEAGAPVVSYFRQLPPRARAILETYRVPSDRVGIG